MKSGNFQQWYKASTLFIMSTACLFSPVFTFGQTVGISPIKMNVLYVGIDNLISVATPGGPNDKITVSISEGTVSKASQGLYNVRVSSVSDECWIKVDVNGKWAGSSSFRVRNLPIPSATISGFVSGDTITANVFRSQAGVDLYIKDFPFQVEYETLEFTFTINDEKGTPKSAHCEGAFFSPQTKEYMDHFLKPGTAVAITNIRAKDPSGREVKVPSLIYFVN
jgi:hypothetical protein